MKEYSATAVAKILRGKFVQQGTDIAIKYLVLDSRKLVHAGSSLFFALKGERRNGHLFLKELYDNGVRNFVVSDWPLNEKLDGANIIVVKDTIRALQQLASAHRSQFHIPVIGITGSNGKTIVKEWLYQLLAPEYSIVRSPKSYNSQIGVPLSVWQMDLFHNLAIFEAGISQPDEMDKLAHVMQPTIGIFTNIGEAHSEGFLNIRQKTNEKLRLFAHAEVIIYCRDHSTINECILAFRSQMKKADPDFSGFKTFSWSKENLDADVLMKKVEKNATFTTIELDHEAKQFSFTIPFIDDASIENAIHCWMLMHYLKIPTSVMQQRMTELHRIAMRLEMNEAINNCSLINDSYNSDLNSLIIAIDFLDQQKQHSKKTVILSDILQSGLPDEQLYREVSALIAAKGIHRLIGVGPSLLKQQGLFNSNGTNTAFYSSTDEFLKQFSANQFNDETILLKGARSFAFERISKVLAQKAHETILEIDLNALLHNLQVYQQLLKPTTKVMAMVKASGYGSGSFEIANALQFHKVDYLAVAYTDEGIELRKAGITLPIMVMNPELKSFDKMIHYYLEPELYSIRLLKQFIKTLSTYDEKFAHGYPIHLELETGMNRLGFSEDEIPQLLELMKENKSLHIQSLFSHLAGSEESGLDDYTRTQVKRFTTLSKKISAVIPYNFLKHIVNSAGIVRFPDAHFDMVRLGIGLYGIDSTNRISDRLQNVSTLKTTISQIKNIRAGETIGYGRSGMAKKEMRIATVGIGYADGLHRSLSKGKGKMLLHNQLAPIVGNICMDMTMLDVSEIPSAQEGDEVMVFGNQLSVQDVAHWADTIAYEIISTISHRVKRVYFQE